MPIYFYILQNISGVVSWKCSTWIKGNCIFTFMRSCQPFICRVMTCWLSPALKWKAIFPCRFTSRLGFQTLGFCPSDGWRAKKAFLSCQYLGFSFTLQRTNCKPLCIVSQPQNEGLIYHVIYFWFIFLFWTSFWVWGYKQNNLTVYLWLNKWHKSIFGKNSLKRGKSKAIVSKNDHLFVWQTLASATCERVLVPVIIKRIYFSS